MSKITHHLNLNSNSIGAHFKKHHKKYIFGLISGALLYKAMSLILASVFLNNFNIQQSFADNTEMPDNPEIEYTEENNGEENSVEEGEYFDSEEEMDEGENPNLEDEIEEINDIDPEEEINNIHESSVCGLGDIGLLSPLSGDILKGEIEISWTYKKNICEEIPLVVKLRDANTQYVKIGELEAGENSLIFDSSLLYSGFYNITGLNSTGEEILLHAGRYPGLNTKYFSGHKIVIYSQDMDVLYEGDHFTIDNESPFLSEVILTTEGQTGNYIGLGKKVSVSFSANEELSGVVVNILGVDADLEEKEDNNYEYISYLSEQHTSGNIIYNVEFEDLAGNTGYYEGYSDIIFKKKEPLVRDLVFSLSGEDLQLDLDVDEESNLEFIYVLSGNTTGYTINSSYGTSHTILLEDINVGDYYNYSIAIRNLANNIGYIGGYFQITGEDVSYDFQNINGSDMLVGIGFEPKIINTDSILNGLLMEIDKFNSCKEGISRFNTLNIPVGLYHAKVEMPELEKSYVRKLVSAFSIVLFERVESAGLNKDLIDKITSEFNDFLVILKLVQDDDNQCEQSLSNYYMSRFRNNLIKYNLAEE
ncbi:MAG: hypothetical protein M0P94_03665 [Candidatus Absconditabacterales bacterium]|nr:hypothetical protein [Candidatus Absconditabacterales bacterium]